MSKPRQLSKLLRVANNSVDNIATVDDAVESAVSASAAALAQARAYVDYMMENIDALPSQSTHNGKYLSTNGSAAFWNTIDALPSQSGQSGKFLTTNGSSPSWSALNLDSVVTLDDISTSLVRWTKIYSASATVISGEDTNANILSYTPGYEGVYINGVLLDPSNYTATSGSTIVLGEALRVNDVVDVLAYGTIATVDSYSRAEVDAKFTTYNRWVKTMTASATYIQGSDDSSLTLTYTPGKEQVFVNGTLIQPVVDYTTNQTGTRIDFTEYLAVDDVVEILTINVANIVNTYTQEQSDSKYVGSADTELIKYGSSQPSSPGEGTVWIDSTNNLKPITKVYNGSTWIIASGAASESGFHPFFGAN